MHCAILSAVLYHDCCRARNENVEHDRILKLKQNKFKTPTNESIRVFRLCKHNYTVYLCNQNIPNATNAQIEAKTKLFVYYFLLAFATRVHRTSYIR